MSYENSNDSMHAMGTLFTFACGAIAGAAVALMFAPSTGRETRALLAHEAVASQTRAANWWTSTAPVCPR